MFCFPRPRFSKAGRGTKEEISAAFQGCPENKSAPEGWRLEVARQQPAPGRRGRSHVRVPVWPVCVFK